MDFSFITDDTQRQKAETEYKSSIDQMKVDFGTQIATEIEKATSGLKTNHDKLLDEKKKLQDKYKNITDPEEALAAIKLLNENEDFKMIRDGKFEEVISKRLQTTREEYETKLTDLQKNFDNESMKAIRFESNFKDTIRDLRMKEAASAAGILPSAFEDLLNRGRKLFTVADDERNIEARDNKGHLVKVDDKILTPEIWIEQLRKTSPHFWPGSKSGSLNSNSDATDLEHAIADAANRNDTKEFNRLRDLQKKNKTGK